MPHRFRETFAVSLLLNGVAHVSILLDHSSFKVTEPALGAVGEGAPKQLEDDVLKACGKLDDQRDLR